MPTDTQIQEYSVLCEEFLGFFHKPESTGSPGEDIALAYFTPYMHLLVHHVPRMFELYKSVGAFSCEYLEQVNSKERRYIRTHSNYRCK